MLWNFTSATTAEYSRQSAMLVHILFSTVTFEFQHLSKDGVTVDPSDGLRHGDVRIGDPRAQVLRFLSTLLLVRNPVYLIYHRLGGRVGIPMGRQRPAVLWQPSEHCRVHDHSPPHSRVMGLGLPGGGHLTHGNYTAKEKISNTSIYFESLQHEGTPRGVR